MAINDNQYQRPYTPTHIDNMGFDPEFQIPVRGTVGFDPLVGTDGGYKRLTTLSMGDYGICDIEEIDAVTYLGFEDISGSWYVLKIDETTGSEFRYATIRNNTGQTTGYSDAWDDRATLTYGTRSESF